MSTDHSRIELLEARVALLEEEMSSMRRAVQAASQVGILASIGALSDTPSERLVAVKQVAEKLKEMHEHLGTQSKTGGQLDV